MHVSAATAAPPYVPPVKAESVEGPGPDHDGDGDDTGSAVRTAQLRAPAPAPGRVDTYA